MTPTLIPSLTDAQKEEIIKVAIEAASKILLSAFIICKLETHIQGLVKNDPTDETFQLFFSKTVNSK